MPYLASEGCFWPLAGSMRSEGFGLVFQKRGCEKIESLFISPLIRKPNITTSKQRDKEKTLRYINTAPIERFRGSS